MNFFGGMPQINILGIILLIAGAVITFGSKAIAEKFGDENGHKNLIIKVAGLILVVVAFVIILVL